MKYIKVNDIYYDHLYDVFWERLGHQFTVWKNDFREQQRMLSDVIELGVEDNEDV